MRSSVNQLTRIRELAYTAGVAEKLVVELAGVKTLNELTDLQASHVVKVLLALPPGGKDAEQQYRRLFGQPSDEKPVRAPHKGESWVEYMVDVCGLRPERQPCPHCAGVGFTEPALGKMRAGHLLLGHENSRTNTSSRMVAAKAAKFHLEDLRRVADSWFGGDLNLAGQFLRHLLPLIAADHAKG